MKFRNLLLAYLLAISCNSLNDNLYKIDPTAFLENNISLTEIADDVSYITLDNTYHIAGIPRLKISESSIFIDAHDNGIIRFDRNGKIANKIGSRGKGPGEYITGMEFVIGDKDETVYVKDRGNIIKVYSKNGDFLRSIALQEYEGEIDAIEYYDSKLFVSYFLQYGNAKYDWIILDTSGNLIQKKERTIPIFSSNWGVGGGTYKFGNKLYYWNIYNDTVFSILTDLSYKPSLLFSPGEHRWPRSRFGGDQLSLYMHPYSLFETSRFLAISYFYKQKSFVLIDKKSKKSFLTYQETDFNGVIKNNIDGGPLFRPDGYFAENDQEYMIELLDPYQLKSHVASREFKNTIPKYPEKKKELEKLSDSLKETDNPVLMIVRLKR